MDQQITTYKNEGLLSLLPQQKQEKYDEYNLLVIEQGQTNLIRDLGTEDVVNNSIVGTLFRIAIELGFNLDQNSETDRIRVQGIARLIKQQYSNQFSLDMLRQAFYTTHLTGASLEKFGEEFSIVYVQKILTAYFEYINEVLPRIKKKAQILENRAKAERQKAAEAAAKEQKQKSAMLAYYPTQVAKICEAFVLLENNLLKIEDINPLWIKLLTQTELMTYTKEEKLEMKAEAVEIYKEQLENHLLKENDLIKRAGLKKLVNLINSDKIRSNNPQLVAIWKKVAIKSWLMEQAISGIKVEGLKNLLEAAFLQQGWIEYDTVIDIKTAEEILEVDKVEVIEKTRQQKIREFHQQVTKDAMIKAKEDRQ